MRTTYPAAGERALRIQFRMHPAAETAGRTYKSRIHFFSPCCGSTPRGKTGANPCPSRWLEMIQHPATLRPIANGKVSRRRFVPAIIKHLAANSQAIKTARRIQEVLRLHLFRQTGIRENRVDDQRYRQVRTGRDGIAAQFDVAPKRELLVPKVASPR